MKYYPVFLDVQGRRCLVVGGGGVAQRKVRGLVEAGAQVTVISPELTSSLRRLVNKKRITHLPRRYRKGDLRGYFLVYGATDHSSTQNLIAAGVKSSAVLLNIVDRPGLCNFIAPAIVKRGDLILAISTGGASPALAKKLRGELEQSFGPEYARALRFLQSLRKKLMASSLPSSERHRIFTQLVRSPLLKYFRDGDRTKIEALLGRIVGRKQRLSDLGFRL
jgi:precorrin-2 dehydrogenase/sirohydrochlorin ferrochelatase